VVLTLAGCDHFDHHSANSQETALDKYVAKLDSNYSYRLVNTVKGEGQTTYILEMTSQAYLTTNEVTRPIWKHWMVMIKPDNVASSKSLLFIGGGNNNGGPPKSADGNMIKTAVQTKSVVTDLRMVPNQP